MENVLTVIADPRRAGIDDSMIDGARAALAELGAAPADAPDWLAPGIACDLGFARGDPVEVQTALRTRLADAGVDVVAQPRDGRRRKLLVADMESTIIANEMIDELAAAAGVGAKVAAITERVVRGELEFAAALADRVAMLAGLPTDTLDRLYARIEVMPGARALVQTMRAHGATTALISGGFTCYSGRVRRAVGFDLDYANRLDVVDGRVTGRVGRPILDRAGKRARLAKLAAKCGLGEAETIAVGDGANDLDMIEAAGMGVAFRAKPVVAESARVRIDHGDLTALLYIQGYRAADFRV